MINCHVCGYSCEDNAELCPICGAELNVAQSEETVEEYEIKIAEPELAATLDDVVLAEVFCDKLKENNILFTSDESDLSQSMHMGFGGFYTEINIYVDKQDVERAKEIYDNLPDLSEFDSMEDYEDSEETEEDN